MYLFLKFIGQDYSMGFRKGNSYEVKIYSDYHFIWIETKDGRRCPYTNPQALACNWEGV